MGQEKKHVGNCDIAPQLLRFGTGDAKCPLFISDRPSILELQNAYLALVGRKEMGNMGKSTSRIIIETVVKKTLRDIKDSPERSIRNLVDMALHFSKGRFQHSFFSAAQTMLQNEKSPYYKLIEDTVSHVEEEHLLSFGMNLGYNGCTVGAVAIRKTEETQGFNIPWMLTLQLNPQRLERYRAVMTQGEQMGIHTWLLVLKQDPELALPLVGQHQDSAMILLCPPDTVTQVFVEQASAYTNLMIAVENEMGCAEACTRLREAGMLYAVCAQYGDEDVTRIETGDLFEETEQLHPVFTALYAKPGCTKAARERVWEAVKRVRNDQLCQTIAWELEFDSEYIDGIISSDSCSAGFDPQGNLITPKRDQTNNEFNLFEQDLPYILKQAFPKSQVRVATVQHKLAL